MACSFVANRWDDTIIDGDAVVDILFKSDRAITSVLYLERGIWYRNTDRLEQSLNPWASS